MPFSVERWDLDCIGALQCPARYNLRRTDPCGPDLCDWHDHKCGNGLARVGFFSPPYNGIRIDCMRLGGPSPYEARCYWVVLAHYHRKEGKYIPPRNWTSQNRGIDPTRVRYHVDAQRFGFTRHRTVFDTQFPSNQAAGPPSFHQPAPPRRVR